MAISISGCETAKKGIDKYDSLVDLDEECNRTWADVEASYQRRNDLIPGLVKMVKAGGFDFGGGDFGGGGADDSW